MPSPFPGMDPWLEGEEVFPDLHERLLIHISEALNATMPPGYVATTKTRVWMDDEQRREPDVSVFGRDRVDPWTESYLEIVSPPGRRLVTAVEVLKGCESNWLLG